MEYNIQLATLKEADAIAKLMQLSARTLGAQDYTEDQIEAALKSAWGLDTQLIKDKTYYLIKVEKEIIACGGWSFRKTLFGNDKRNDRDSEVLNPDYEAAKIRAFFVHPEYARKGLGKKILEHCEQQAWEAGFRKLELGATISGEKLYHHFGYQKGPPYEFDTGYGSTLTIIPMTKSLA